MRLAFFGYAWNPQLKIDAYMDETIEAFARAGADVDLYLGGQLARERGIFGINPNLQLDRLAGFIAAEDYDAAISFNNSMLIPEVTKALQGKKTVSVLVDEPEHLFDYLRKGPFEAFKSDIEIVSMSSSTEARIKEKIKGVGPRLHFRLPATRVDPSARSVKPKYPISFVASYVGDLNLDDYLKLSAENPEYYALTVKCLELLERYGNLLSLKAANGREQQLMAALPWTFEYFQAQLQNILTNRRRVEVVERLTPHGLALFGNAGWLKLLTFHAPLMKALQPGPSPSKHAELRAIYNASKISINVPQAHVQSRAVQFRVSDVMASNALLITQHHPQSDLYRVFGPDCPVPTFTDLADLERLCIYYLAHEDERLAIVSACNALLAEGYDFDARAIDLLAMAGLKPEPAATRGEVRRIDLKLFYPDE